MSRRRLVAFVLDGLLVGLIVSALALAALAHVVPALGWPVFVVRSPSMAPAVPIGSAVILDHRMESGLHVGDVVTLRLESGALFTHRITRLVDREGVPYVESKGDANAQVDPAITPATRILGRVAIVIPWVGFLMAGLATLPVALAVILAAMTVIVALWYVEVGETEPEEEPRRAAEGDRTPGAARGVHYPLARRSSRLG